MTQLEKAGQPSSVSVISVEGSGAPSCVVRSGSSGTRVRSVVETPGIMAVTQSIRRVPCANALRTSALVSNANRSPPARSHPRTGLGFARILGLQLS